MIEVIELIQDKNFRPRSLGLVSAYIGTLGLLASKVCERKPELLRPIIDSVASTCSYWMRDYQYKWRLHSAVPMIYEAMWSLEQIFEDEKRGSSPIRAKDAAP